MSNEIIFDTIAKQEWLEAASDPISRAIRDLFPGDAGRAIKNALHGTWLGHPLHPVLTDIPVGAWTLAMIFDALDGLGASKDLRAGADFESASASSARSAPPSRARPIGRRRTAAARRSA
jgi:hypothetical protein